MSVMKLVSYGITLAAICNGHTKTVTGTLTQLCLDYHTNATIDMMYHFYTVAAYQR